jgi:hypothetical protein
VEIIPVNLALNGEVCRIETSARGDTPITVNPSAIQAHTKGLCQETEKRPNVSTISNIPTFIGAFRDCKIREYGFVSNGGIIERERTGKETVTGNAVGLGRMSISEYCQADNEPAHEHVPPPRGPL